MIAPRRNRSLGACLVGALAAALVAASPAPAAEVTVVVHSQTDVAAAAAAVLAQGGTVLDDLALVNGVLASVAADRLDELADAPDVDAVWQDAPVVPAGAKAGEPLSTKDFDDVLELHTIHATTTGAGVDIALIDTGVAPLGEFSGSVVDGVDFSVDKDDPALANNDGFGHGTHLAGIIHAGVAPGARIVDVKVGSVGGGTSALRVVQAIDWVVHDAADAGFQIRVINLALSVPADHPSGVQAVEYAVDQAWAAGIVVVVAAGNTGGNGMTAPATSPRVIAVGGVDPAGTPAVTDDVLPTWTASDTATRTIDLIAPGQRIESARVRGSVLDEAWPAAQTGGKTFVGSGTSQASAVVTGAVALVLQARPTLTPDEVKHALHVGAKAHPLAANRVGRGLLDVTASLAADVSAAPLQAAGPSPTGSVLDGAVWDVLAGHQTVWDVEGEQWMDSQAGTAWGGTAWGGTAWGGTAWGGTAWGGTAWGGTAWGGTAWG